ncbi:MAG: penicillin-binding protein 2 [Candidatus Marinimicrobia bacterium]|nr:penicillin-binding protein 2 [Candidatus Neomarinimicrobiota bacterium]
MFVPDNLIDRGRFYTMMTLIVVMFIILIGRFYSLQVHQHQKYMTQADANRIREVTHPGPRGLIFDRYGNLLVDNRFSYIVSAIPWELQRSDSALPDLSEYLSIEQSKIQSQIQEGYRGPFIPVRLTSGLSFPTISKLEEHRLDLPGVILSNDPIRYYSSDASLAHVLGYLREIDERELNKVRQSGKYQLGDLIGWNGIERKYEDVLKGTKGVEYVQVNAVGQEIGRVEDREPVIAEPGFDLHLSLDSELQAYTESLFDTSQGAVVLLSPRTGEIQTFVSAPSYSLSQFSGAIDLEDWRTLQADTLRPLFNRGAVGMYPPGSTFKLITAIAALEENVVSPQWTTHCPGYYRLGRRVFRCWRGGGHGTVNMSDAIQQSCNVYFYTLIRKVGIDNWAKYAEAFGFGTKTGIDLPEEAAGILPDKDWMDSRYGERRWTEGNLLNMTVGQGDVLVTPLQMAHFAGMIATAGIDITPHLGIAFENEEGRLEKLDYDSQKISLIDSSTYKTIIDGMYRVVNEVNGTGRAAKTPDALVFGKTGTAQIPPYEDHAWFIGIMQSKQDLLAIAVLVEHGGSGGAKAAPIAGRVFRKFIELREERTARSKPENMTQAVSHE